MVVALIPAGNEPPVCLGCIREGKTAGCFPESDACGDRSGKRATEGGEDSRRP